MQCTQALQYTTSSSSPHYVNLHDNAKVGISEVNYTEMSTWSLLWRANTSTFHITFGTHTHQCENSCSATKLIKLCRQLEDWTRVDIWDDCLMWFCSRSLTSTSFFQTILAHICRWLPVTILSLSLPLSFDHSPLKFCRVAAWVDWDGGWTWTRWRVDLHQHCKMDDACRSTSRTNEHATWNWFATIYISFLT